MRSLHVPSTPDAQPGSAILYIWNRDLTGRLLVSEIVQAADHGVRVRLLLDDINAQGHDPRSIPLNAEMGVVFEHGGLVRQMREIFADETSPQKSYRLRIDDGKIIWRDEAAEPVRTLRAEPEAGIWRRLTATVIGLLPIESQL